MKPLTLKQREQLRQAMANAQVNLELALIALRNLEMYEQQIQSRENTDESAAAAQ